MGGFARRLGERGAERGPGAVSWSVARRGGVGWAEVAPQACESNVANGGRKRGWEPLTRQMICSSSRDRLRGGLEHSIRSPEPPEPIQRHKCRHGKSWINSAERAFIKLAEECWGNGDGARRKRGQQAMVIRRQHSSADCAYILQRARRMGVS